jgi:hypothetical protein
VSIVVVETFPARCAAVPGFMAFAIFLLIELIYHHLETFVKKK